MPKDEELVMRSGEGTDPNLDASESGPTSLTPLATNGQAVIQVDKTALRGIPVSAIVPAIGTGVGKFDIGIEASDKLAEVTPSVTTATATETTITVDSTTGLVAGEDIYVYDDNANEYNTIVSIDSATVFSVRNALAATYDTNQAMTTVRWREIGKIKNLWKDKSGRHTAIISTQKKYLRCAPTKSTPACNLGAVWVGVDPGAQPTE